MDLPATIPSGLFGGTSPWPYIGLGAAQRLGGTLSQAEALATSGAYTAAQERTNAQIAEMGERDSLFAGDWTAAQIGKRGQQVAGSQLASSGAQGVTAGSLAPELARTQAAAATDALMARYNGYGRAFGYKMEAIQDRSKAAQTKLATRNVYNNTLATGGLQAIEGGLSDYLNYSMVTNRGVGRGMRV